jgi:predicted ATPase/DNA-binding SARP family transcriptional activator
VATSVRLLGTPVVEHADGFHEPPFGKGTALLWYLAYHRDWVRRDDLLFRFWPDATESTARENLRKLVNRSLRPLPFTGGLESDGARLRWAVPTDVHAFREALAAKRFATAFGLYRGPLLGAFGLPSCPEFEDWLDGERRALHGAWRDAALHLAGELGRVARPERAAEVLGHLHAADPLDEDVLEGYLRALAASDQRSRAIATFDAFAERLAQEVGGEPDARTLALIDRIRRGDTAVAPPTPASVAATPTPRPRPELPMPATRFVGREAERRDLHQRLSDRSCRLLTLTGPGGIGKTRLALQLAAERRERYADGACFVSLVAVGSTDLVPYAIADALDASLVGSAPAEAQLLEHLRSKDVLLVLDNLEHLLTLGGFLHDLLEACPGVTLLVTSRERLDLQGEHVFDLGGLTVPPDAHADADSDADPERYDSVRLFAQAAARARRDFVLSAEVLPAVTTICRLVDGLPLALELAASWLRVVPANEVAREVAQGIDILAAETRDLPERHRSLRAVLDQAWQGLTDAERSVLQALSVAASDVDRATAEALGASLPLLASLVNKSLVRSTASGRFALHPLVRQYAAATLAPEAAAGLRDAYAHHVVAMLRGHAEALAFGGQYQAVRAVERELEHVRAAVAWAAAREDASLLGFPLSLALSSFFQFQSRYGEALHLFTQVTEALEQRHDPGSVQARMEFLLMQGWFYLRFGRLDEAEAVIRASAALAASGLRLDDGVASLPETALAAVAMARGAYDEALRHATAARCRAETLGHVGNLESATYYVARARLASGDVSGAEAVAHEALAVARRTGETWFRAYILTTLGDISFERGALEPARRMFLESHDIRRRFGDHEGVGLASARLGEVAMAQQRYEQARRWFHDARAAYERVNDYGGLSRALAGLGDVELASGDLEAARAFLAAALRTAAGRPFHRITLRVIASVADLLVRLGRAPDAAAVARLIERHPARDARVRERLGALPREALPEPAGPPDEDLTAMTERLLATLS